MNKNGKIKLTEKKGEEDTSGRAQCPQSRESKQFLTALCGESLAKTQRPKPTIRFQIFNSFYRFFRIIYDEVRYMKNFPMNFSIFSIVMCFHKFSFRCAICFNISSSSSSIFYKLNISHFFHNFLLLFYILHIFCRIFV